MGGANGGRTGSVVVPPFTLFSGSPSHVAEGKVRRQTPAFMAQSETKLELLKRQYICLSQVTLQRGGGILGTDSGANPMHARDLQRHE
jgi:hypothetical protein